MSDMETHTPRIGAIEIVGTVAAVAALAKILRTMLDKFSDAMSDNKATVNVLVDQLQCIIRDYERLNRPTPPAHVEVLLSKLNAKAQKLLETLSAGMLRRGMAVIAHGKFETRIGKLRTGITDVGNALVPPALRLSAYQTSPALLQQHLASAPASAPSQPAFMQVTFTCPLPPNMDAAHALGGFLHGHIPVQAAPQGYPPLPPAVYSPAVTPPVYYSTLPPAFYPPIGPPAYSYPPKY